MPSLVPIGQSKLQLLSKNYFSILVTVTLTLITDAWLAIPIGVDVSYIYSKFGVNRQKQTKVIEQKLNFYF